MTSNETHVILGTGTVGFAIMDALIEKGITNIRMVNRSGKTSEPLPENIELVNGDLTNPAFVTQVTHVADVVYTTVQPAYHKWETDFPPLQNSIIEGVSHTGAKLVVMENVYMYGDTDGAPLHEGLPYAAHTRKGKVRAEMSNALIEAHKSGKLRVTIGRASDFFGPRALQSATGERVFYPLVAGKAAQFIGNVDLPHSYTYTKDIGRALVILGERDEALGQAWHIPNAPVTTTREFLNLAFDSAGHPTKISILPKFMMNIVSLFMPTLNEIKEMLYEFEKPFIVESKKFEETFSMSATPLSESIPETVAWFKTNPQPKA